MSYAMFAVHNEKAHKISVYFYTTTQQRQEPLTHIQEYNYAGGIIYTTWRPSQPSPVPKLKTSDLIGHVKKADVLNRNSTLHRKINWTEVESNKFRAECDELVAHKVQQEQARTGKTMDRRALESFRYAVRRVNVTVWAAKHMDTWFHEMIEDLISNGLLTPAKPSFL